MHPEISSHNWYGQRFMQVYLDQDHVYRMSNSKVILPGVTTIIKDVLNPYRHLPKPTPESIRKLNWQGKLGTYIHTVIELDLKGQLDVSSVVPPLLGYYESWLKIKKFLNIRPICMEKLVYDLRFGYAGTMDLRALVTLNHDREYRATLDFKSGKNMWDHWRFQAPAYMMGFHSNNRPNNEINNHIEIEGNGLWGYWDFAGRKIRLPMDYENEVFIVVKLDKDGDMPKLKITTNEGDPPYKPIAEWVDILTKYHYKHGGYDAESLFGEQYA